MTLRPEMYEVASRKRKPKSRVDGAKRSLGGAVRRILRMASAVSSPLGDILALVRRRLAKKVPSAVHAVPAYQPPGRAGPMP